MTYLNRSPGALRYDEPPLRIPGAGLPKASEIINCCVPYWDERVFMAAGGRYRIGTGYHVLASDYLPDFEHWLPRKWQDRGTPPAPVLLPDMLPSNTWEANLRTQLTEEEWGRLRKFCYQAAGSTCIACGSRGEPHLEAHEAWSFDEKAGVQKLKGIQCLCPTCHKCKHIGISGRLGLRDAVHAKLMWLNDWSPADLERELAKVMARQEALSKINWQVDTSFLRTYGVR